MNKKKNDLTILIGRRIAAFRKKAGLSQQDLEDITSKNNDMEIVRYRTLSLIEQGYGEPKISTLYAIARALDVPLSELLNIQSTNADDASFDNFNFLLKKMSPMFLKTAYQQIKALALLSDEVKHNL